jgi:hypothetical protein
MTTTDADIAAAILALVAARGPDASICPSEAARVVAGSDGDWRARMADVRRIAHALAAEGRIEITQRGVPVGPGSKSGSASGRDAPIVGPVRLRLPRPPPGNRP